MSESSETKDDFLDDVLSLVGAIAFEHGIDADTKEIWRVEFDDESGTSRVVNYHGSQAKAMESAQRAAEDGDAGEINVQRFTSAALNQPAVASAPGLTEACESFRDQVLHGLDQFDNCQTNQVLDLFDCTVGEALARDAQSKASGVVVLRREVAIDWDTARHLSAAAEEYMQTANKHGDQNGWTGLPEALAEVNAAIAEAEAALAAKGGA